MGCSPTTKTSPASPCCTVCTESAGLLLPGIYGRPRKTGPVFAAPSCRNSSDVWCHSNRMPFFLYPFKLDNPCLRVSKYPLYVRPRTKPRESVFIKQASLFPHPKIIQVFSLYWNSFSPNLEAMLYRFQLFFLPTRLHGEALFLMWG